MAVGASTIDCTGGRYGIAVRRDLHDLLRSLGDIAVCGVCEWTGANHQKDSSMHLVFGFIGMPGLPELAIIAFVVLLLFGKRLPSVMGSLGKSIVEFKKGVAGIEDDVEEAAKDEKISGKVERDPNKE